MQHERIARPDDRSRLWARAGASRIGPGDAPDERSMRALEILVAGLVLAVVGVLSLVQPPGAQSLGMVGVLALGGVLFVVSLVSLIR